MTRTTAGIPTPSAQKRIITQLAEIERAGGEGTVTLGRGATLTVSNLGKSLFGKGGATKGDVMRYYTWAAPYALPLMKDRALSLKRFPNGISAPFFYQQKAPPEAPSAVRVERLLNEQGEAQERLVGGSLATLLYCVQLGAIEVNPWNARVKSLEYPDFTVIDLHPGPRAPYARVVETALWVRDVLKAHGLHGAVKTSGSSGMHVFIPLPPKTPEDVAVRLAVRIAVEVTLAHPKETTVERSLKARKPGQIYVDAGQNSRGKTVAAAYSVRAKRGATVSTPLRWEELTPALNPSAYTIETLPQRVERLGDLWGEAMRRPNPRRTVTGT